MNVLTHCNAGWLAFVDVGSATAPLYAAQARGKQFHVFCDETRPRSPGRGAHRVGTRPAGHLPPGHRRQRGRPPHARGKIDLVIVGSDRTLGRTGEVANKIGTYTKAILAHRHGIPFYVAIPLSTIDWRLQSGRMIPIEERDEDEVLGASGMTRRGQREFVRIANPSSRAFNPGFDITPPELITGIITPAGIFKPATLWKNRHRLDGPR